MIINNKIYLHLSVHVNDHSVLVFAVSVAPVLNLPSASNQKTFEKPVVANQSSQLQSRVSAFSFEPFVSTLKYVKYSQVIR